MKNMQKFVRKQNLTEFENRDINVPMPKVIV